MAKPNGVIYSSAKTPQIYNMNQGVNNHYKPNNLKLKFRILSLSGKLCEFNRSRRFSLVCQSRGTQEIETKERVSHYGDSSDNSSGDENSIETARKISSSRGIAEAFKFAYNDAKFVNERARNDIVLLSRSIKRLDARARQDVAILGSEFLKLDARAREDTEKIDNGVKRKAEKLHHVATVLERKVQSRLKSVADKHWSDGALEADLKRADFVAKQRAMEDSLMALERAMEDSLMALEFVKNIHDMMVSKMNRLKRDSTNPSEVGRNITLEKNGKNLEFFPGDVSSDRIEAIQEAYQSIASALSEADGFDYTDPEELELLVTTLIDLDAMDGKSSVSLLAECSSSPDEETRRALANALSVAPSMWTLGNAGMGALQRLAEDSNPAIAAAASNTIYELKKQWDIEEGDSLKFMMNQTSIIEDEKEDDGDNGTS